MPRIPKAALAVASMSLATSAPLLAGTLVGGGGQWKVRDVATTGYGLNSIGRAEVALTGYRNVGDVTEVVDQIDYGVGGNFGGDRVFPGLSDGVDNFALEITGQINVTSPGDITFGLLADDGARLEIDGNVVVETVTFNVEAFGTVTLSAGLHDVRVVAHEGSGEDFVEVFVAQQLGTYNAFTDTGFELLDSVSDQGPAVISASSAAVPSNALAGAVVADLSATGGAGGGHRFELVYPLDPASPLVLIGADSTGWTYLDDGTEPAIPGWQTAAFDDSAWAQGGVAPLGYNDAAITTVVSNGTAAERFATTYFRKDFVLPIGELERVDSLRLRLLRDDGAAVYINGVEVLRDNLPGGALDKDTLAAPTAGGVVETTYFEYPVDRSVLVDGINTIAVEVHQASLTSSDLILDIALDYDRRSVLTGDEQYFEISGNQLVLKQSAASMPAGPFNVAIRGINAAGASSEQTVPVSVGGIAGASPSGVSLDASSIVEGQPAGTLVGLLSAADADAADAHSFVLAAPGLFQDNQAFRISGNRLYTAEVFDAAVKASYSIRVTATDSTGNTISGSIAISVDPAPARIVASPSTIPLNAEPFAAVADLSTVDSVTGEHSYSLDYALDPTPVPLIDFGATWRYLDDGSDQGTVWSGFSFNDGAWSSGLAPLGYGQLAVATAVLEDPVTVVGFGPDEDNKFATTYFRTNFTIADPGLVEELVFDMELDDSAIVFINGSPVFRVRANSVVAFDDYSLAGDGGEATNDVVTLRTAFAELLFPGINVLAVELHQTNATSSDLWLDLSLSANLRAAGSDSDHFYLVGNQLVINKEVSDIPAVVGDSFTLQIESVSEFGEVVVEDLVVSIGPAAVGGAPTDIVLSADSVEEGSPVGTVVGTLSGTDPDGDPLRFSLSPTPFFRGNSLFQIDGDQLVTFAVLDYDDAASIPVRMTVTDSTGNTYSETLAVNVLQVFEEPTNITTVPAPATFASDAEIGTTITQLLAVDPNEAETHTYTFGTWEPVPGSSVLDFGSDWSYLADGSDQGAGWIEAGFDDTAWPVGAAELGYGDGDEATDVGFVDADPLTAGDQKNATTYFRGQLSVLSASDSYALRLRYDDGAAVYINGTEVYRVNLAAGALFDTYTGTNGDALSGFIDIPDGIITVGSNTVAVEMHQSNTTSSDISFDMEIVRLVASPYPSYFTIAGDELRTAVDFSTTGLAAPFTFRVPVIATDPEGLTYERFISVEMTGAASDTDLDGLLDQWELDNFGDLSQTGAGDPDSDGRSNLDEYGADTDPNDAGDFLQISQVALDAGVATVTWPAKPDRTYALYRSDDLSAGSWVLVQGGLTTGAAADLDASDLSAPNPGDRFYRVEAEAPPLQ